MGYTLQQLQTENFDQLHIVLGVVNDKNLATILPLFPKNANYYFCKANIPRALDASTLQKKAIKFGLEGHTYPTVTDALAKAKKASSNNDLIYVGGSTFVVAEVV